jgi:DNA-binding CsgD family transcriptional regulator/tetratricopeptide (TPR) repeat protein
MSVGIDERVNTARATSAARGELLERSRELSKLDEWLRLASDGSHGRLVLVAGEAGIGKTTLLRRLRANDRDGPRFLWGACEALFTPRPLGPLLDIAEEAGGEFADVVATGAKPHDVVGALIRALGSRAPSVLVLEDLHWADEATLDVLRLLARRIASVPALALASYRDDELDRDHPLRIVLGELGRGEEISRITLAPLSPVAVAKLAEPHGVDADDLYRTTAGNPFFVTEVLAAGAGKTPPTVRDAVLARMARVGPAARTLLEAVAVAPPQAELWLLETLAGDAAESLEECLAAGMLAPVSDGVAFRHELARIAVEESLPPNAKLALHKKALAALASRSDAAPDVPRLAHHAEAAGDAEAVLRFAPEAAVRAASVGAHREAAAQYARALRFAQGLPPEARAELLDHRARECGAIGQFREAITVYHQALECHRQVGDVRKEGDSLCALAWPLWVIGRGNEAEDAAKRAVAVLEQLPPGRELARAYAALSSLLRAACDLEGAVAWGTRALELARSLDDFEAVVQALMSIGAAEFVFGATEGREKLERSLELAREAGLEERVAAAFCYLARGAADARAHALAESYANAGIEYCSEHDLDGWRPFLVAVRGEVELDQGRWGDAADSAALILANRGLGIASASALVTLGRLRARRGDPGQWAALDDALELAEPSGELTRLARVAAARAEAAWLEGRPEGVAETTGAMFELAQERGAAWVIGELAYWRWRAGVEEGVPPGSAEPYALQIAGEWRRAADLWANFGCPYEHALALADADDDQTLLRALEELQRLGARPAASIVARRLRERGAHGLPRGPRPGTQQNPANLTSRQVEVLELVAQGLRNAEIAKRLFLSERTVAHHVSAILRKLEVPSRGEASAAAVRLGLAGQDR